MEGSSFTQNVTDHTVDSSMSENVFQDDSANPSVGDTAVSSSGRKFVYK